MLNHNHQNSNCDFSADLISYFYGEINQKEKSRFEAHLAQCSICPIELAEFSDVQTAFGEWRSEFAQMPTPVINVPYENVVQVKPVASTDSDSWLARLRQTFSLSPAWSAATAAMALLLVCSGLFLFATDAFQTNDVAKNVNPAEEATSITPTIDLNENQLAKKSPTQKESTATENAVVEQAAKSPKISSRENETFAKNEVSAKPVSVKIGVRNNDVPKNIKQTSRNGTAVANKDKNFDKPILVNSPAPTLNNYEEIEDETLRLADLFAEVDTKN